MSKWNPGTTNFQNTRSYGPSVQTHFIFKQGQGVTATGEGTQKCTKNQNLEKVYSLNILNPQELSVLTIQAEYTCCSSVSLFSFPQTLISTNCDLENLEQ